MNNVQLVIPMSGVGQRFINAGYKDPKPLIEVDGKPMIAHVLDIFNNPEDVIFICNDRHLAETNMCEVLLKYCPTAQIYCVPVGSKRGPVEVVMSQIGSISSTKEIIISYCDYGTVWNFEDFLKFVRSKNADFAIPTYTGFHPHMLGNDHYAYAATDKYENIVEVFEKEPFLKNKMDHKASNGTYYFKNKWVLQQACESLLEYGDTVNNEYYMSLACNELANDFFLGVTYNIDKMLQWGTPYDLECYRSWSNYFARKNHSIHPYAVNPPNTTLILPMAGEGKRFKDEGYSLPKPMIDVDGHFMFAQAVECLPHNNSEVYICQEKHIKEHRIDDFIYQKTKSPFCNVVSVDEKTDGQACTCLFGILKAHVNLFNPIFISACDNGVIYDTEKYQKLVDDESIDVIVWSFRNNPTTKNNPDMYSYLTVREDNTITNVTCKKSISDNPMRDHAIIGSFFFRLAGDFVNAVNILYDRNERVNNEFYVDSAINVCIENGLTVKVFEVENYICWGTPNDYKSYVYWSEHFQNA